MPLAARVGDAHVCPVGGHVGGPISGPGSPTVNIGGRPAARVGDQATCPGGPDTIAAGCPTVNIDGRPAARVGDASSHSGLIVAGCPTVNIGTAGGGAGTGGVGLATTGGRPRTAGRGPAGLPAGGATSGSPQPDGVQAASKKEEKPEGTPKDGKGAASSGPGAQEDGDASPKLFGSPVSMEVIRALMRMAQQMIPGLAGKLPAADPAAMQGLVSQLREAIARKDIQAVNALSTQVAALVQRGADAPAETQAFGGKHVPD